MPSIKTWSYTRWESVAVGTVINHSSVNHRVKVRRVTPRRVARWSADSPDRVQSIKILKCRISLVCASINRRCLALRAQPALGSCSCLAVLYQFVAAHVTRRPVPISHRNWLYRISSSFLTTGLGLSGVNFDDQAVGTNSKTRSRHRPRLSWESASIYPHEMSLKP